MSRPLKRHRDPWWTWRWDKTQLEDVHVPHIRITRWRRGSFLTVYRMETHESTQWWVYLPFNIGFGFAIPRGEKDEVEISGPDESGAVPRSKTPEDGRYWN